MLFNISTYFEKAKKKYDENLRLIKQIEKTGYNPDILEIVLPDLIKNNSKVTKIMEECVSYLPAESYLYKKSAPIMKMQYIEEDKVYHCILDDLLPHRTSYNESTGKIEYYYDKHHVYNGYKAGLEEFNKEAIIMKYEKPITALFINYYTSPREIIDHDNLEVKVFIDAVINKIMIPDDNPTLLTYIMDYAIGEKRHTEVYIGPFHNVVNYSDL